jgi:hypothetical protein
MNNIYGYIQARLGNQLFIIFATISYYIDNKCKDYILCASYSEARDYFWDTLFSNISQKVSYKTPIPEKYKEPFFHYKEIPIFNKDTVLEGYFQSHKYFQHNFNKIKEIIGIDANINEVLLKYPEYTVNKTILIHHRIGDAATVRCGKEVQLYHPIHKPKYYINAFKTLICKGIDIYDYDILYFCEEENNKIVNYYNLKINSALKELTGKDLRYKKVSDDIPNWEQLLIMTSAKHYIIANSTFSWVGAYLSLSKEPIICCPATWFGPGYNGTITDDLYPENWIKIDEGYNADDLRPETYYKDIENIENK